MQAAGRWCWWNQYSGRTDPAHIATCIQRAKRTAGVIIKAGYWITMEQFKAAGVPVAVESYVYPTRPEYEADLLVEGIRRGAKFTVVNAEVEWESTDGQAMRGLCQRLRAAVPSVEIYASVDTRGNRTHAPYQQALGGYATGWMPMIYPKAFRPTMPPGAVAAAFRDCLDAGQNFQSKPVLPTVQTYDAVGAVAVEQQLTETANRQLPGCQAYTVGHATEPEWQAFIAGQEQLLPQEEKLYNIVTVNGQYYWLTDGLVRVYIPDFAQIDRLVSAKALPENIARISITNEVLALIKDIGALGGGLPQLGVHSHKGAVTVQ